MLMNLLLEKLHDKNLKLERFHEITSRLLSIGIIVRDEGGVEQRLYDDARRVDEVLSETFALLAFRLVHDAKNEFYRLYAPGAQIPGMTEDGYEPVLALRARLSPDFVAAALALRFMYQQGLAEGGGRLTDTGEVLVRFDELATTLQTQVKRLLPDTPTECKQLLAELKKHRIIHFNSSFAMDDEDALIAIRPVILGIVSDEALATVIESEGVVEPTIESEEVNS